MSAKYSGRIHDPNHLIQDYDIYFNDDLIQIGTDYGREFEGLITREGTSVTIPDGVTIIGANAFRGMGNLEQIHIPDSVRAIQENVFPGCYSLKEIYIPDSVKSIRSTAFSAVYSKVVIKCGFSDGAVEGAPWSAPPEATILYDQIRPNNDVNSMVNTPTITFGISNVDLINKPERPDIIDESANIEEA